MKPAKPAYLAPVASETHFFSKLVFAAPASFLSWDARSHVVRASLSHFVMKLVNAAPASFLYFATLSQLA